MRDSSYFHEIDIQRNALTQCKSDTLRLHQSTVQAHCQICLENFVCILSSFRRIKLYLEKPTMLFRRFVSVKHVHV